MATQVQNRRGTTAEHSTFTGAVGEVTIDTDKDTVVVHDGSTAGGRALLREDGTNSALALGSAGTPSLKFTGDTNTGIYSPGADQVAISTNGSGRLFVDASGNVGVGVSTPSQSWTGGSAMAQQLRGLSGQITVFRVNEAGGTYGDLQLVSSGSAEVGIYNFANGAMRFGTNSTERLRITSDGNVGVGTSNPSELFNVATSSVSDTTLIRLDGGAGIRQRFFPSGGTGKFNWQIAAQTNVDNGFEITPSSASGGSTFSTPAVVVKSNGNVGIGTSSPSTALHAFSTGTAWLGQFGNITANGSNVRIRYNAIGAFAANSVASNLLLNPDGGAVGIGSTTVDNKLQVVGDIGIGDIGTSGTYDLYWAPNTAGGSVRWFRSESSAFSLGIGTTAGTTEQLRVDGSGRLLVGTSSSASQGCALQVRSDIGVNAEFFRSADNSGGPYIALTKTRGTAASPTEVSSGDDLGTIDFLGYDGATYRSAATIQAQADGTWTDGGDTTDNPGRLVFSTTSDGASSPSARLTIESTGALKLENGASNLYRPGASGSGIGFSTNCTIPLNETGATSDNTENLGAAGTRWATVYAGTSTINTSDATLKQNITALDQAELQVATAIKSLIKKYRFKDAVAEKGNDARIHVGVIAQEVEQAFVDEGLDPRRYALFCEDTLEDGSKRLGIRYDELLAFVIAAL